MTPRELASRLWRLAGAAVVALTAIAAEQNGLLVRLQDRLTALRMEAHTRPPSGEIVLVDIDAKALEALGRWPWPRQIHGELVDRLTAAKAAEIAFDIDFSTASNPADDAAFEEALRRAGGGVILATFLQDFTADRSAGIHQNRPLARFADNAWLASVTLRSDSDGLIRRNNYGIVIDGEAVPSMASMLSGGRGLAGRSFLVDFSIDARAFERVSAIDVLRGTVEEGRLAGKKIIIGAQATELRDLFQSPVGGHISGSLLQALAAETLIQGRALWPGSDLATLAGVLAFAAAALAIGSVRWQLLLAALAASVFLVESAAAIVQGAVPLVLNTAPPALAALLVAVLVVVSELNLRQLLQNLWRRRAADAESILSRIVDDNFAGILVVDGDGGIRASSQAAMRILDATGSLVGRRAADLLPVDLAAVLAAGFARPTASGEPQRQAGETTFRAAERGDRTLEYVVTFSRMATGVGGERGRSAGNRIACLTFNDVTQQRADAARLAYMARYDAVTRLPNRNHMLERLDHELADRAATPRPAVVCFDLDGFKAINDTYGHAVGDLLLCAVAAEASRLLPPGGLAARLGGDEFAAVIAGGDAERTAADYAARLIERIAHPFELAGQQVHVGVSAGVAAAESDQEAGELLMRADVALYRAKADGGSVFRVFEPEMLSAAANRQRLELDLRQAVESNQFEVWYQPQVELATGRIVGAEALVRWRHPRRGFISPTEFIPVAEAIGLIVPLGRWVLETACAEAVSWPEAHKLAVNFSSAQFTRGNAFDVVASALKRSGLEPSRLELEITESVLMKPSRALADALRQIRSLGVSLALDDFGTGYSSLSYIQKFPVSKIKIDRSFVANLPRDQESCAIVRAVARLAGDLGIRINAEGIEVPSQVDALRGLGVEEGQGFLFGKAQPADQFRRLAHAGETPTVLRASA